MVQLFSNLMIHLLNGYRKPTGQGDPGTHSDGRPAPQPLVGRGEYSTLDFQTFVFCVITDDLRVP